MSSWALQVDPDCGKALHPMGHQLLALEMRGWAQLTSGGGGAGPVHKITKMTQP